MTRPALTVHGSDPDHLDEEATERIWTAVTPTLSAQIDDYFHEHRFKTRSSAVRQLIELGLRAAAFRNKQLT